MPWNTTGNANTNAATDFLGTTDTRPLVIRTNNKAALEVDPTGKVGIGTATPQNLLHVGSGSTVIASTRVNAVVASTNPDAGIAIAQNIGVNVMLQASTAGGYIGTVTHHPLTLRTSDLDRLVIDSLGNTGLAQNRPQNLLHIGPGISTIASSRVNAVIASANPDAGIAISQNSGVNVLLQASGAGAFIGTTSNHALVLRTGDLDRVVVDSRGDMTVQGNLSVAKDLICIGADCAEHFDVAPDAICEPGTVMIITSGGVLDASRKAYDRRVAGVVSGASKFRPAILLDSRGDDDARPPIALAGKVYCRVDSADGPIEVGDLLTTSETVGHAMKATDRDKAFGAIIGKALAPFSQGCGLIPILVTLQ